LPDDCVCCWLAGFSIPEDGGLALIRNADSGKVLCAEASLMHCLRNYFLCAQPDLLGIVFHPAWPRINLAVFLLRGGNNPACAIEHDETRARGSLVERSDVIWHFPFSTLPGGLRLQLVIRLRVPLSAESRESFQRTR